MNPPDPLLLLALRSCFMLIIWAPSALPMRNFFCINPSLLFFGTPSVQKTPAGHPLAFLTHPSS